MDRLQRLHGSFKSNEGSSEGQKENQPRGENAIGFGASPIKKRKSREGNLGVSGRWCDTISDF